MTPRIKLIEAIPEGRDWEQREIFWIKLFRAIQAPIMLNHSDGGKGYRGTKSGLESRDNLPEIVRQPRKGRIVSAETRRKLSAAMKGKKGIIRRKGALRNRIVSEETRKKLSAALTGRKISPEVCRKISLANQGQKRTPEQLERLKAGARKRMERPGALEQVHRARMMANAARSELRKQENIA